MTAVVLGALLAARALADADPGLAPAAGATAAADSGARPSAVLTAGYFFKGMMFYDNGRGGAHATAGWLWPLPWRLGLWTGGGAIRSRGRLTDIAADGESYSVQFEDRIAYVEATVVTPWFPFPLGPVLYWHETSLSAAGRSGPQSGRTLRGSSTGAGLGLSVRLLGEWFPLRSRKNTGLAVVLGYMGLMDFSPVNIPVRDAVAGGSATIVRWRPLAGESLQAGVEYRF